MNISGKVYRINSKGRFTLSIAIVSVIAIVALNGILGLSDASSMTRAEYIEIEVQFGDTLWDIAKTYMPRDRDIRESVYTLCQINEIKAHELQAGQSLIIPSRP
jgi:hypothetical protein